MIAYRKGSWHLSIDAMNRPQLTLFGDADAQAVLTSSQPLQVGRRHTVAFTTFGFRNAVNSTWVYVDGDPVASGRSLHAVHPSEEPVRLGSEFDGQMSFQGSMEQVRFFMLSLTVDEIMALSSILTAAAP